MNLYVNFFFIIKSNKYIYIYTLQEINLYLVIFLRFSTALQNIQFIDLFGYNVFNATNCLFYNFRCNCYNIYQIGCVNTKTSAASITIFFSGSSWYEREIFELNSIYFYNKSDLRHLILPYYFNDAPYKQNSGFIHNQIIANQFNNLLSWIYL